MKITTITINRKQKTLYFRPKNLFSVGGDSMDDMRYVQNWNDKLIDLINRNTGKTNPRSLNEATKIIEDRISIYFTRKLRWIALVRNKVVHENSNPPKNYSQECFLASQYLTYFFSNNVKKDKDSKIIKLKLFKILSEKIVQSLSRLNKRNFLILIPVAILAIITILIYSPVKKLKLNNFAWSPTISFERDDDFLNKDDYYLKITIFNGVNPYKGNFYVSLVSRGIAYEKSKSVDLIEGESESFVIPIDYSIINREDANNRYIAKSLEGSSIIFKTGYLGSNKYVYKLRNGKLSLT